jgi:hypothetical protein
MILKYENVVLFIIFPVLSMGSFIMHFALSSHIKKKFINFYNNNTVLNKRLILLPSIFNKDILNLSQRTSEKVYMLRLIVFLQLASFFLPILYILIKGIVIDYIIN